MNFLRATELYEEWLGARIRLIPKDLDLKHQRMRRDPFEFLRSTFYRWAQIWRDVCGDAVKGPAVLSVGDLHVENFGTWRDAEGRLVWGINDFDEAFPLPYTADLIRLATSARFAPLSCSPKDGCATILEGYTDAVKAGGRPFILAERHDELREMASARLHQPVNFWDKLVDLPPDDRVPSSARKALARSMPDKDLETTVVHRVAGLGSLGRERFTALARWAGGRIAREAKTLAPSAGVFASGRDDRHNYHQDLLDRALRCPDPFVRIEKRWVVRRLAPDCSRIELGALPKERHELLLLRAMGWETANVHLGTARPRALKVALEKRKRGWLNRAAQEMERAVLADFKDYSTR